MLRARIISCLKEGYWYANCIGMQIDLNDQVKGNHYVLASTHFNDDQFEERDIKYAPSDCLVAAKDITFTITNEDMEYVLRPMSELEA
jgi:hypothetical protein